MGDLIRVIRSQGPIERLPGAWALLAGTLLLVVMAALVGIAPIHWVYADWAPARDFRGAALEDVVADFEATGVVPRGSTWASPELKRRRVTLRYAFYHERSTVVALVAARAGVVIEAPATFGCGICGVHILGPVHVRAARDGEAGAAWLAPPR